MTLGPDGIPTYELVDLAEAELPLLARLVTREEILKHANDDRRVLEAAQRYEEKQTRWRKAAAR